MIEHVNLVLKEPMSDILLEEARHLAFVGNKMLSEIEKLILTVLPQET